MMIRRVLIVCFVYSCFLDSFTTLTHHAIPYLLVNILFSFPCLCHFFHHLLLHTMSTEKSQMCKTETWLEKFILIRRVRKKLQKYALEETCSIYSDQQEPMVFFYWNHENSLHFKHLYNTLHNDMLIGNFKQSLEQTWLLYCIHNVCFLALNTVHKQSQHASLLCTTIVK